MREETVRASPLRFPGAGGGAGGGGGGICSGRCCPLPPPTPASLRSLPLPSREGGASGPSPLPPTPREAGPLLRSRNFLTTWAPRTPAQLGGWRHRRAPSPGSRRSPPPRGRAGPAPGPAAALRARERHLSSPQRPRACLGCSFRGRGEAERVGLGRRGLTLPVDVAPGLQCPSRAPRAAGALGEAWAPWAGRAWPAAAYAGGAPRGTPRLLGAPASSPTGLRTPGLAGWRGLQHHCRHHPATGKPWLQTDPGPSRGSATASFAGVTVRSVFTFQPLPPHPYLGHSNA